MSTTSQITFTNECHSKQRPKRAPRAPNAFMLYRSDFLKRQAIPPEVEKRQQNLSRIAGQCWNMLPETEKAIWYGKAAVVRAEYCVRYSSHKTGPIHKDTDRLSSEDERNAINPRRPCGRARSRRTQTPYGRSMFGAIQDPASSSPTSLTSLISQTSASELPLSTTASPSPLSLSHLLPSFTSHTNPSSQDTPFATSGSSIRNEIGDLLELLGSETPHDIPSGVSSSQEPYPRQHENVATCVPYPGLEHIRTLHNDPVSETNTFSPAVYYLAGCHSLANNLGVTDNVAHFNPSLVPLYP